MSQADRGDGIRFYHNTQNVQFKTYELFVSGIFHYNILTVVDFGNQSHGKAKKLVGWGTTILGGFMEDFNAFYTSRSNFPKCNSITL